MAARWSEPLRVGRHRIENRVFVAPMAGVTDRPFRQLCKRLGADYAVGEMAASNALLWATEKTSRRINHEGEPSPKVVQIAGGDAEMLAQATAFNIDRGAEIIDINMGCPAKKVCNKAAGSALMQDEALVRDILQSVLAVAQPANIPITLKIRTGWDHSNRNALGIALMAQDLGISMLTIHGRTREDRFTGNAEYETIAQVKSRLSIPVVANGDIDSPEKARWVLEQTGADAIMIGRAGQGRPWIYRQIFRFLQSGERIADPTDFEIQHWLREHLLDHYRFYGEERGVRSARKHIGWYLKGQPGARVFRELILAAETPEAQLDRIDAFFASRHPKAQAA